jgi:Polysaccharide deacetylase
MHTGIFTISLDLEIHWGVSDNNTIESYKENLRNVPEVVRRLLQLFKEKNIHATWATVGMLFCRNKEELFAFVKPEDRPTYIKKNISNYIVAEKAGKNETDDPYHYAPSLIRKIIETPHQEIASHTYSHYYCLEPGQNPEQFFHDLTAAKQIAEREQISIASIVFPANQFQPDCLQQCRKQGIKCYRGNYPSWIYQFQAKTSEGLFKRMARLIDTYLPLKGNRYVDAVMEDGILNIPASCFLRPYQSKLSMFEGLRVSRMKKEMKAAAKKKKIYHLWWHPHNFGRNMDKNFLVLKKMLDYYLVLNKKYNMQSLTMEEIYNQYLLSK